MGWILLGLAIGFLLNTDASLYLCWTTGSNGDAAARLGRGAAAAGLGSRDPALRSRVLLFPDGRLPSNRLRWVPGRSSASERCGCWARTLLAAWAIFEHNVHVDPTGNLFAIDHPTGFAVGWSWLQMSSSPCCSAAGCSGSSGRSALPCADGERRLQLKWLLSGAATFVVSLPGVRRGESARPC